MSVLQKYFQKKFKCRKPLPAGPPAVIELPTKDEKPRSETSVFLGAMPPPYLRLVLFQEEGCERRLLFDSKSFEPQIIQNSGCTEIGVSLPSNTCDNGRRSPSSNVGRPYQHVYVRGPQDSDVLSEMLFGTVGMASRASSLKIHIMKDPKRLMLSRVFCVESAKETGSLERGLDNQRPTSSRRKAQTLPVPTPEPAQPSPMSPYQSLASSLTKIARSDSSSSLMSLLGASLGATGSLGSRSSPNPILSNKSHSLPPVRQSSRDSFTLTHEPHSGILSRRTKVKIGFAVIFRPEPSDSSFQQFFFEHFSLVESYVTFLKEQVENALNNFKKGGKAEFVENMMDALNTFISRIQSIYSTPRLSRPVWPTLMSQSSNGLPWNGDDKTIECFISELARMVTQHNTKQKNFFMTGLVTSALTHHLGWVNTTMLGSENDRESKVMAYNPLWAQLGDLYGAVGTPTKVAKTVVVGEIHEVVSTIISILSYFIRCSAVKEVVTVPGDFSPQAFCKDMTSLKMSFVQSDLESSEYVLVDMDDNDKTKSITCDEAPKNTAMSSDSKSSRHSFYKTRLCQKNSIASCPIDVAKDKKTGDEAGSVTSNGSLLCRSRSSPATSTKPYVKFYRQQSSGNFETSTPRARTNSNETFAKPRSVQSRRTSRNASKHTSHSASSKSIPDEVLSLDVTTDCHDNSQKLTNENALQDCDFDLELLPVARPRTHKRVSSEPFTINNLQSENSSSGLTKTKSTYFQPIRQETFVENLEPKVINVAHVQRALPVMAQSPNLQKSTRILGFKTNEKKLRELNAKPKHFKSVTVPNNLDISTKKGAISRQNAQNLGNGSKIISRTDKQETNVKCPSKTTPKTAPVISNATKFDFNKEKGQRSISTGNAVRRNSSGKPKIAARRRNLPGESQKNIEDERPLPPFQRIPSISLEHDEFNQYFSEEEKEGVTFFMGTESGDQSSMSCNQSTTSKKNSVNFSNSNDTPIRRKSTTTNDVTIPSRNQQSNTKKGQDSEKHSSMTTLIPQKAENPSMPKRTPPPLPASRPVGRKPPAAVMKSPPPLPSAAPVHRGPLYPNLSETSLNASKRPTDLLLPQSSIYPSLKPEINPKPDIKKRMTPPSGSLYPSMADYDVTTPDQPISSTPKDENSPANLSLKLEVPLREVDVQAGVTEESSDHEDKRMRKLNYGNLVADYSPEYLWGFALHGTRNQPSLFMNVMRELRQSTSIPVLDEQIAEAVTIIADTDKWSVKVLSSHRIHSDKLALPALNSKLVNEILEKIKKLYQMNVPASFCMQQLEQSLGELVMKSKMLADYVCGNTRVKMPQLSAILGIESSDLPLLMAIASCHSPQVGAKLLC